MRKVKNLGIAVLILVFAVSLQTFSQTKKTTTTKKPAGAEKLHTQTLEALMSGNKSMLIMEKKGGKYSGGERLIGVLVNAPFEKCWEVVTDFEKYKEFVPEMSESVISSRSGNEVIGDFKVEVKFMGIGCTEKYQQKYILKKEEKIIEIADPKTGEVGGSWKFIPTLDGKRTIILYQDRAPFVENMCWTAKMLVKVNPDAELALHSAPPFMYIAAMKERIEGKK